ncbi:MAG: pitrilysin family protein [Bacteroidales bacterium]|jgi:zinc protease|nr:pitrilysin family protein [Bacteroidales bacterium]
MLHFSKHQLANGLRLIVHEDKTTPLVCINTLYNVGAKFENPKRTGMAHLFEHLMFTGSKHAVNFDKVLEAAGGENNAFTNNDITNYYETLPAINIETAIFLEADRMQNLSLTNKSIKAQKSVVIEEFKERYLNQPYGDMDELIRKMSFKTHPYRWSTIGIAESHIADATKSELLDFYHRYYSPDNAIIAVAGNVNTQKVIDLIEKYFGNIPQGNLKKAIIPKERIQNKQRIIEHWSEVAQDAINISMHMPDRMHPDYYAMDLISDILSNGKSSRLYKNLVKGKKIFTELDAWIDGSIDPGLLQIFGHPHSKYSLKDAENALLESLQELHENPVTEYECSKVANKAVSSWIFSGIPISNKAFNLAYFELLGDIGRINEESEFYLKTTHEQIQKNISERINPNQFSILRYYAK